MSGGIPENVTRLIADHIKSVEQLEVLLLLREHADRDWDAYEVTRELRNEPESARSRLEDMAARGFLERSGEDRYRYRPSSSQLSRSIDGLAEAYARRRHTVIGLIFSSPSDAIQSFADAFRLRRDD